MKYEQLISSIINLNEGEKLFLDIGEKDATVFLRALIERLHKIDGKFSTKIEDGILHVVRNRQGIAT